MSAELDHFLASMTLTHEQWHDGHGYNVDALAQLAREERQQVEELLTARTAMDWRDVDALGTPGALAAMERALQALDINTRVEAAERLCRRALLGDAQLEQLIVAWLPQTTLLDGMTRLLTLATAHASPAVRKPVLSLALTGNERSRSRRGTRSPSLRRHARSVRLGLPFSSSTAVTLPVPASSTSGR